MKVNDREEGRQRERGRPCLSHYFGLCCDRKEVEPSSAQPPWGLRTRARTRPMPVRRNGQAVLASSPSVYARTLKSPAYILALPLRRLPPPPPPRQHGLGRSSVPLAPRASIPSVGRTGLCAWLAV